MSIVDMALNQLETNKTENAPVQKRPERLTMPAEIARKKVSLKGLGKISRRKTETDHVFDLVDAAGEVVGRAEAIYKTKSQRTWTVEVKGIKLERQHTINKALRAMEDQLAEQTIIAPQSETTVTSQA